MTNILYILKIKVKGDIMKKLKNIDLNQDVDFSKVNEKTKGFWKEFKRFINI